MTGRERYHMSAKALKHGSRPRGRKLAALEYGRQSFRLTCRRVRGPVTLPTIVLDDVVTGFAWERAGVAMTGTLRFADPTLRRLPGLVRKGDVVRCEVRVHEGAAWRPLWEMAVATQTRTVSARTTELELRSKLAPAQRTRHNWRFRTTRAHPRGWTADEITRWACRRFGITVGDLPRGQHRIDKLVDKSASVLEIVTAAWRREREHTGRRFDVSIGRGVLDVREVRRPRYMLLLGPTLLEAAQSEGVNARFASVVVVTSTAKRKGSKRRRKIRAVVIDRARVRRYGYVRRSITKSGLASAAEARRYGKRWLARTAQPWTQITLSHAGIPWVQRGDGIRLDLPEELLTADVYVLGASHRVDYGSYTMDLRATVTDVFAKDEREVRVKRRKVAAARRRRRRTTAVAPRTRATPKKAAKHS